MMGNTYGQEGVYYYGSNTKPVDVPEEAIEYKEITKRSQWKYGIKSFQLIEDQWKLVLREKVKIHSDGSQMIRFWTDGFFPKKITREMEETGPGIYYFRESSLGGLIRTGTTSSKLPLHLVGTVTAYHSNGKKKSISEYSDNQLLYNENWLPDGSKYIDSIFFSVDKEPEYRMGNSFFRSYLIQQLANSKLDLSQIEDLVVIGWVVMENGEIDGVISLQGKSRELNRILVNAIKELPGKWQPAHLEGKPVRFFMSIPLNIMHQEARFQSVEFSGGVMHYNRY
jgi:hypothetical protein